MLFDVIEVLVLLALAALWYFYPAVNWEPIYVAVALLLVVARQVRKRWASARPAGRFPSADDRIRHRERLKVLAQQEIGRCRREKLRQDAIVRDVRRLDSYPEIDASGTGLSPWFKIFLVDTYDKGIVVCLRDGELKSSGESFRYPDTVNGERGEKPAMLMADIPYDSISTIDVEGDKFYPYPHIYCYLDYAGTPYVRRWFAEEVVMPNGSPFFKPVATYEDVIANSSKEGKIYFG